MVTQVSTPVRWDLCMETMLDLGVTGVIEMPPAGTLTGIAKRAMTGVETFALKTPDDLDEARAFVRQARHRLRARHLADLADAGGPDQGHLPPRHRRAARATRSTTSSTGRRGRAARATSPRSCAPHGGTVVEWLVEDGDPVSPGQPLVRLHPEGVS